MRNEQKNCRNNIKKQHGVFQKKSQEKIVKYILRNILNFANTNVK